MERYGEIRRSAGRARGQASAARRAGRSSPSSASGRQRHEACACVESAPRVKGWNAVSRRRVFRAPREYEGRENSLDAAEYVVLRG